MLIDEKQMNKFIAMLRFLKPTDTLDKFVIIIFLIFFMLNFGQAPVGGGQGLKYISFEFLALTAIIALRNIYFAGFVLLILNVYFRLYNQISHWGDQIFVQNYGVSSIMSGVNIYSNNNLAEHSFSYYLPMGSLFGSLPIFLGLEHYWNFYHILIPLMLLIPFAHSPSILNLCIFIVTAFFFPLVDYTTGGGNVELSYAVLIPGIYLLVNSRNTLSAIVLLSFGIMTRQPNVFLIPFVFLVLYMGERKNYAWGFALLIFFAGGWYILQDISGFLRANFLDSGPFQEIWYKRNGGLTTNFSISTLLQYFGVGNAWNINSIYYTLSTIIINTVIALFAGVAFYKKRISVKSYIALGILSVLFVYLFSKGFAFLHYLIGCCYLFLALYCTYDKNKLNSTPDEDVLFFYSSRFSTIYSNVIAGIVLTLILFPLLMVTTHQSNKFLQNIHQPNYFMSNSGLINKTVVSFTPARAGVVFPVGSSLIIEFENRVNVESITLLGERFTSANIEGIEVFNYPNGRQTTNFIRHGEILGSADGVTFNKIRDFNNVINYHVYPLVLPVGQFVKTIQIKIDSVYDKSTNAVIGNVGVTY
jgi:hypothetical protein